MRYKEHTITKLVRTKQFWQYRLKGEDARSPIYLKYEEIKPYTSNPDEILDKLCSIGQLERVQARGSNGNTYTMYGAKNKGSVKPSLLTNTNSKRLDNITTKMMKILKDVSLKEDAPSTPYFVAFLNSKSLVQLFFIVDKFSGRVHTPITSFKSEYREHILIDGQETTSLDVVTMQPVLLGSILKKKIGGNEFSKWIDEGEDVYIMLQSKANLKTRDEAKKRFFEILFSRSNDSLQMMFGNSNWITWINDFKNKPFEPNPRTIEKNHSNLAWLLQNYEVHLMRKVWEELLNHDTKFLSVHDEIIVKQSDQQKAKDIFSSVLSEYLSYFRLSDKHSSEPKQANNREITTNEKPPDEVKANVNDKQPITGKLYSIKELKEKFHLTDEDINKEFEEFYHNILWMPLDGQKSINLKETII